MDNFFKKVKESLRAKEIETKFSLFDSLYLLFQNNKVSFEIFEEAEVFSEPSFQDLVTIVHPNKVKHRKNIHEDEGKIALLHAVAHIEYSAIDLALDACYRFQSMPKQFYKDWLEVADDEIRHFKMIRKLLNTYNHDYGDLDVHQGLFDASMKSLTLIKRMAFIPRYMEANGLDSNQAIIKKLKSIPNTQNLIETFQTILDEEIDHVKKGDIWYKFGCNQKEGFTCDYFDIVNSIYPNSFKTNKSVNIQARKQAGFSDEEIKKLQSI